MTHARLNSSPSNASQAPYYAFNRLTTLHAKAESYWNCLLKARNAPIFCATRRSRRVRRCGDAGCKLCTTCMARQPGLDVPEDFAGRACAWPSGWRGQSRVIRGPGAPGAIQRAVFASITVRAVTLTMRRTVLAAVRIFAGLATPRSTGPITTLFAAVVLSRL